MMMLQQIILLFSFASYEAVRVTSENSLDLLSAYISSNYLRQNSAEDLCTTYSCCDVATSGNGCSISAMKKDKSTLVFPGGETRCIYSYSTPFAFQVIPGDSDKVLLYFQAGGACWDKLSNKMGLCLSNVEPQSLHGVFSRDASVNSYAQHTVIHISYCSGDVFGGNVTQSYNDNNGQPIVQNGIINAQSAVDWLLSQQAAGYLSASLTQFTIMGSSAGSLGTQLWANKLLKTVKHKKALVVPDSYSGLFPPGTVGPLMNSYNLCASDLLTPALKKKCFSNDISVQDIAVDAMRSHPDVPFAFVQSKIDDIQQGFYIALGVTLNSTRKFIVPALFYAELNAVYGLYNRQSNFVTFLVNGDKHCFTQESGYYDADAIGYSDANSPQNNGTIMMSEWLNQLVKLESGQVKSTDIESVCLGTVVTPPSPGAEGDEDGSGLRSPSSRNDYCTSAVVPKTLFA